MILNDIAIICIVAQSPILFVILSKCHKILHHGRVLIEVLMVLVLTNIILRVMIEI